MTPDSAEKNLLTPLRTAGLIDEEAKPTERAYRWRDDAQYPAVCEEIREEVYPEELLDAFPEGPVDRSALGRWFANKARVGEGAARQMASFYLLLLEADHTKQGDAPTSTGQSKTTTPPKKNRGASQGTNDKASSNGSDSQVDPPDAQQSSNGGFAPSLHIDVQVHISPEASPEQINTIFASMAKHLYKSEGA